MCFLVLPSASWYFLGRLGRFLKCLIKFLNFCLQEAREELGKFMVIIVSAGRCRGEAEYCLRRPNPLIPAPSLMTASALQLPLTRPRTMRTAASEAQPRSSASACRTSCHVRIRAHRRVDRRKRQPGTKQALFGNKSARTGAAQRPTHGCKKK